MSNITTPTSQMSQVPTPSDLEQQSISLAKGIAIILVFTILLAVTGLAIGKKFFWNNYTTDTQIQHELKLNQDNVKNDPSSPTNHANLGWTYLKMGEYDQAVGEFKKTLSIEPKNYGANLNLGLTYIKLEQYDKAITALKDAISIMPSTYQPHLNLALSYYQLDQLDFALAELEVAYRANPGSPDTMYVRGMVFEKQNKLADALRQFEIALSFNPKDEKVQASYERVKKALGK